MSSELLSPYKTTSELDKKATHVKACKLCEFNINNRNQWKSNCITIYSLSILYWKNVSHPTPLMTPPPPQRPARVNRSDEAWEGVGRGLGQGAVGGWDGREWGGCGGGGGGAWVRLYGGVGLKGKRRREGIFWVERVG